MSNNVILKMSAYSNISYNREAETGLTVEEWAMMDQGERAQVMTDALWDDIEVSAVDEETGEYLD